MSAQINQGIRPCCAPVTKGYRLLTFPDGSQAGVIGLDIIFDDAYREGKRPGEETTAEIIRRLEGNNYIAPFARKKYEEAIFKEYVKFCVGIKRL